MNDAPISEFLTALIKLAALQLRLGIIATEAAWAFGRTLAQPNAGSDTLMQSISEDQIDIAARAIELKLIGGYELGFQCLLRTNFPDDVIREMAKAALEAAHHVKQAAPAIIGRLVPQRPARRQFHRTLLVSAGPSLLGRAAVPSSRRLEKGSAKSARLSIS